jgi:hypothetical protein
MEEMVIRKKIYPKTMKAFEHSAELITDSRTL